MQVYETQKRKMLMKKIIAMATVVFIAAFLTGCDAEDQSSSSPNSAPAWMKGGSNNAGGAPAWMNEVKDDSGDNADTDAEDEEPAEDAPVEDNEEDEEAAAEEPPLAEPEEKAPEANTAPPPPPPPPEPVYLAFRSGIWWTNDGLEDNYYYFNSDGRSGVVRSQQDKSERTFTYSYTGTNAEFVFSDGQLNAMVESKNDDKLILHWDDGRSESFSYYSEGGFNSFHFYSCNELADMSMNYYEKKHGCRPDYSDAKVVSNGLIEIHLYDDNGDYNYTCDWYLIDRFNGSGTDMSGNVIYLTE